MKPFDRNCFNKRKFIIQKKIYMFQETKYMQKIVIFIIYFAIIVFSTTSNWMTDVNFVGKSRKLVYIVWPPYCFLFLLLIATFFTSLLIFPNWNIAIVLFPPYPFISLNEVIKLWLTRGRVSNKEIVKQYIPDKKLFGQHDQTHLYCYLWYQLFFAYFIST